MSYAASETSVQGGAPVELYDVAVTIAAQLGDTAVIERWQYADGAAHTAAWPITQAHASGTGSGGFGGDPHVIDMFHAGSFADIALVYQEHTYGVADGILPLTTYRISCQTSRQGVASSFERSGIRVSGNGGASFSSAGEFSDANQEADSASELLDATVTTDVSGEIIVRIGQFVLSWSSTVRHQILTFGPIVVGEGGTAAPTTTTTYWTSADVAIVYAGHEYTPAILRRESIGSGGQETQGDDLVVRVPRDHAIAALVIDGVQPAPIRVTHRRLHRSDLTDAVVPGLAMQIEEARFDGPWCILTIRPPRRLWDAKVPRVLYAKTCQNQLYDARCQVNPAVYAMTGAVVGAIDGLTVTITGGQAFVGTDTTYFEGGALVLATGRQIAIEAQAISGTDILLTLLQSPTGLAVSDTVTLLAGCDYTSAICHGRFRNAAHRLAFAGLPVVNPWDGAGLAS